MKKVLLAGAAALLITGTTVAYAQHRPWFDHMRPKFSAQDRSAFADARIASVHAGLKLTPDQEKLWPPVEAAVKDLVKLRIDRAEARMKTRDEERDPANADPVARMRDRADNMAATAAALKKVADAADPLYKSLDDGQKRRLKVLTRFERMGGFGGHHHRHFMHRDRDNDDRGPGFDRPGFGRGPGWDRGPGNMDDSDGPHRL
ncbi:Spy/CpxP family protein refolding chaperone [Rhodopseudomonas sp. B29]|uniref:Spy/CpxP family protein refolding chaperone n=1 Tax=Rhodopseudomonas sp. B29 TaxID=95607 RepID=UPI000345EF36|nr:Spy/CpxP family protein refolding chaperone [Rhodopseudomonas sp. B29]